MSVRYYFTLIIPLILLWFTFASDGQNQQWNTKQELGNDDHESPLNLIPKKTPFKNVAKTPDPASKARKIDTRLRNTEDKDDKDEKLDAKPLKVFARNGKDNSKKVGRAGLKLTRTKIGGYRVRSNPLKQKRKFAGNSKTNGNRGKSFVPPNTSFKRPKRMARQNKKAIGHGKKIIRSYLIEKIQPAAGWKHQDRRSARDKFISRIIPNVATQNRKPLDADVRVKRAFGGDLNPGRDVARDKPLCSTYYWCAKCVSLTPRCSWCNADGGKCVRNQGGHCSAPTTTCSNTTSARIANDGGGPYSGNGDTTNMGNLPQQPAQCVTSSGGCKQCLKWNSEVGCTWCQDNTGRNSGCSDDTSCDRGLQAIHDSENCMPHGTSYSQYNRSSLKSNVNDHNKEPDQSCPSNQFRSCKQCLKGQFSKCVWCNDREICTGNCNGSSMTKHYSDCPSVAGSGSLPAVNNQETVGLDNGHHDGILVITQKPHRPQKPQSQSASDRCRAYKDCDLCLGHGTRQIRGSPCEWCKDRNSGYCARYNQCETGTDVVYESTKCSVQHTVRPDLRDNHLTIDHKVYPDGQRQQYNIPSTPDQSCLSGHQSCHRCLGMKSGNCVWCRSDKKCTWPGKCSDSEEIDDSHQCTRREDTVTSSIVDNRQSVYDYSQLKKEMEELTKVTSVVISASSKDSITDATSMFDDSDPSQKEKLDDILGNFYNAIKYDDGAIPDPESLASGMVDQLKAKTVSGVGTKLILNVIPKLRKWAQDHTKTVRAHQEDARKRGKMLVDTNKVNTLVKELTALAKSSPQLKKVTNFKEISGSSTVAKDVTKGQVDAVSKEDDIKKLVTEVLTFGKKTNPSAKSDNLDAAKKYIDKFVNTLKEDDVFKQNPNNKFFETFKSAASQPGVQKAVAKMLSSQTAGKTPEKQAENSVSDVMDDPESPSKLVQLMGKVSEKLLQSTKTLEKTGKAFEDKFSSLKGPKNEVKKAAKDNFGKDKSAKVEFVKSLGDAVGAITDKSPESTNPLNITLLEGVGYGFGNTISGNNSERAGNYAAGVMGGAVKEAKIDKKLEKRLKQIQAAVEQKGIGGKQAGKLAALNDLAKGGKAAKKLADTIGKTPDPNQPEEEKALTPADILKTKLSKGQLNLAEVAKKMGADKEINDIVKKMFTGKHEDTTEPVKPKFKEDAPKYIKKIAQKFKDEFPENKPFWNIAEKIAQDSDPIKDQVARMLDHINKTSNGTTTDEAAEKIFDEMKDSPERKQMEKAISSNFEKNFQISNQLKDDLASNFTAMFKELKKLQPKRQKRAEAEQTGDKKIGTNFANSQAEPTKSIVESFTAAIKKQNRRQRRQATPNEIAAFRNFARELMVSIGQPTSAPILQDFFEGFINAVATSAATAGHPLISPMAALRATNPTAIKGGNAAKKDILTGTGQNSLNIVKQLTNGLKSMNNPPDDPEDDSSLWWIGVIVGVVVLLLIILLIVVCLVMKKKKPEEPVVAGAVAEDEEPELISETMSGIRGVSFVSLPPTQVETEPTQPSVEENQQIINVNIIHIKADGSDSITNDTDTDDAADQTMDEASAMFSEGGQSMDMSTASQGPKKEKKKVKRSDKKKKQEDKKQKKEGKAKDVKDAPPKSSKAPEEKSEKKDGNQQIIIIHHDAPPTKDQEEPKTKQESEEKAKSQQPQQIIIVHHNAPEQKSSQKEQPKQKESEKEKTENKSKETKQQNIIIVHETQQKSDQNNYEQVMQRRPSQTKTPSKAEAKQKSDEKESDKPQNKSEVKYIELNRIPSQTKAKPSEKAKEKSKSDKSKSSAHENKTTPQVHKQVQNSSKPTENKPVQSVDQSVNTKNQPTSRQQTNQNDPKTVEKKESQQKSNKPVVQQINVIHKQAPQEDKPKDNVAKDVKNVERKDSPQKSAKQNNEPSVKQIIVIHKQAPPDNDKPKESKTVERKPSAQKSTKLKDEPSVKQVNVVDKEVQQQDNNKPKDQQSKDTGDQSKRVDAKTKEVKDVQAKKEYEEPRYEPVGGTEEEVKEQPNQEQKQQNEVKAADDVKSKQVEQKQVVVVKSAPEPKAKITKKVITVTTITTTNQETAENPDVEGA